METSTRFYVFSTWGSGIVQSACRSTGAPGAGTAVPAQVLQPATALALANQQETERLRQAETERIRLATAATLLAQQQLAAAAVAVPPAPPPAYQPVSYNGTLPGVPTNSTITAAFGAIDPTQS